MAELKNYKLTLTQAHTEKEVQLTVQSNDWDAAYGLAEALAKLMPPSVEYFDKQDAFVTAHWGGMAEEITVTSAEATNAQSL